MLNQTNQKIKLFDHQTTQNTKPPYPEEDESSYLAPLYSTNSMVIDNYLQLVTYFV